jgi:hypothetical protein
MKTIHSDFDSPCRQSREALSGSSRGSWVQVLVALDLFPYFDDLSVLKFRALICG